ncbi:hypothetical protein FPOA_11646 [Fusarium poae]|uniref:Uncharacterized protein n=1 Tax=Fusarium poae TaxID=36050 RepID=A0A1B8AHI2_FUSPO|nr:hypothetical protein FPOA_11646 [Fusarium poae]
MFLNCFRCGQENRKQAVLETNKDVGTDTEGRELDDTAIVPADGFLGRSNFRLPTYEPKDSPRPHRSHADYVRLSIKDILSTMRKESHLARCILFETARLQRSSRSGRSLKLSQHDRILDLQLLELEKVLLNGNELIRGPRSDKNREKQSLIIKGKPFKKALRTAKKSLLELAKSFNDQILRELENGLQRKEKVDYEQINEKITILKIELQKVYKEVKDAYNSEKKRQGQDQRAQTDDSGAKTKSRRNRSRATSLDTGTPITQGQDST